MLDLTHLSTARLLLRRPTPQDTDAYFAIHGDPNTHAFNPAGPVKDRAQAGVRLARMLDHWQNRGFGPWAVSAQANPDDLLGFGGLSDHLYGADMRTNLGFRFSVAAWGMGYATELGSAALQSAWRMGLPEIWASVRENNIASRRVIEKIGMLQVDKAPDPAGFAPSIWYVARAPTA